MEYFDVVIVGAGPAGLHAAAQCAESGLKTCLLEGKRSAGKKLLITGQGKCNITNTLAPGDFITHYGGRTRFVRSCIYGYSGTELMSDVSRKGLKLMTREDGKVFPATENAADVLSFLLKSCSDAGAGTGADIRYCSKAVNIEYSAGGEAAAGGIFTVEYSTGSTCSTTRRLTAGSLTAGRIIISTGGFTFPSTGSDGSGYTLAEKLGHRIISPRPSLAGITAAADFFGPFASCAGTGLNCGLELYRDGRKLKEYIGRLLFTHKGLSGPAVVDNSRDFMRGDVLRLNLLSERFGHSNVRENAEKALLEYCAAGGKRGLKTFFTGTGTGTGNGNGTVAGAGSDADGSRSGIAADTGRLSERLVKAVFSASGSSAATDTKSAELSSSDRKKLITAFTALDIEIAALDGRNKAMCTAGGVDTAEVNPNTMESKLIPGLYFAGEVLDVDGDSGGFNLQFAFSSAHSAAAAVSKSAEKR